jgi:hypothetical protein
MSQSVVFQYLSAGSFNVTVPSGFSNQVLVYAWGAGGGTGTGAPGGGGGYAAGVITIDAGDSVVISVGGAGGSIVGRTAAGSPGGTGNNPVVDLSGGVGAPGGDPEDNDAGGGGGGGGASAVFINNIPMIVAAGAGGGGGLGEDWGGGGYENGKGRPGGVSTQVTTTPRGANGRKGGAGGAGGGGGGYPFGGDSQRSLYGDDVYSIAQGGFGGQNYANATVTSSSLLPGSGTNTAGTTSGFYPGKSRGVATFDGCVILVFQKLFTAWIKRAGDWKQVTNAYIKTPATTYTTATGTTVTVHSAGWKQIVRGWMKKDGVWKDISTPLTLESSRVATTPSTRARINIVIASNTTSYDLLDTLNSLGTYYPGYSDITLTVNAGVVVDSDSAGDAALTVDGLTSGDSLIIVNNGTIRGRGGAGGAPGWLKTTTFGSGKNRTTSTSAQPAYPGGAGGTGLAITYIATLENNGNIYAGGGGGGGGGINLNGSGGGAGGGGAGFGPGANAGTATTGGAGAGNGGAGGSNGANGTAGANAGSAGGAGGIGGKAIVGYAKLTVTVEGTIVGPRA